MHLFNRTALSLAFTALCVVLVSACGQSGSSVDIAVDPTPTAVSVDRITLGTSQQVLLSGVGAGKQLEATAYDSDNNVVDVPLFWSSSDTAIVEVSSDGKLSATGLGFADITVATASDSSGIEQRLRVSVPRLRSNTFLVDVESLASAPIEISPPAPGSLIGTQLQIGLDSSFGSLSSGQFLVADDWSFFGRVISVTASVGSTEVVIETTRLEGLFDYLEINSFALIGDMENLPDTSLALSSNAQNKLASPMTSPGASDFTLGLNDVLSCTTSAGVDITGIASDIDPKVDLLFLSSDYQQNVQTGVLSYGHLIVNADLRIQLDGSIDWNPEFSLKINCQAPIQPIPAFQHGPLMVALPLGLGFSLDVSGATTFATLKSQGYVDVVSVFGIMYSTASGFETVKEAAIVSNADVTVDYSALDDVENNRSNINLQPYSFIKPRVGLGLTTKAAIYTQLEENRFGTEIDITAAGIIPQVQQDFQSNFVAKVYAERAVNDAYLSMRSSLPLIFLALELQILEALTDFDLAKLFSWRLSTDLDTSPIATIAELTGPVVENSAADITVTIQNNDFLLLEDVVERVEVHRVEGAGLDATTQIILDAIPEVDQTAISWNWTPTQSDAASGTVRLIPVIYTKLMPGIPIIGSEMIASVLPDPNGGGDNQISRNRASVRVDVTGEEREDLTDLVIDGESAMVDFDKSFDDARVRASVLSSGTALRAQYRLTDVTTRTSTRVIANIEGDMALILSGSPGGLTVNVGGFNPSWGDQERSRGLIELEANISVTPISPIPGRTESVWLIQAELDFDESAQGVWRQDSTESTPFSGDPLSITIDNLPFDITTGEFKIDMDFDVKSDTRITQDNTLTWDWEVEFVF